MSAINFYFHLKSRPNAGIFRFSAPLSDSRYVSLGWAQDEPPQEPLDEVKGDSDFAAVVLDACARITPFWNDVANHLRANQVSVAAGQYSITPDGKPLIGASAQEGLYFLTGDNGFGVESAPQAARHLVRLITGELSEQDNPFRVDRPMHKAKKIVL